MNIPFFRTCCRALVVVCVAITLHSLCAQSALATCGDYLMDHRDMAHEAEPAGVELSGVPANPEEPPVRRPCDGPGCRQAPASPPPTAPERTTSSDQDRWCACLEALVRDAEAPDWLSREGVLLIPDGAGLLIEHPPRG